MILNEIALLPDWQAIYWIALFFWIPQSSSRIPASSGALRQSDPYSAYNWHRWFYYNWINCFVTICDAKFWKRNEWNLRKVLALATSTFGKSAWCTSCCIVDRGLADTSKFEEWLDILDDLLGLAPRQKFVADFTSDTLQELRLQGIHIKFRDDVLLTQLFKCEMFLLHKNTGGAIAQW